MAAQYNFVQQGDGMRDEFCIHGKPEICSKEDA